MNLKDLVGVVTSEEEESKNGNFFFCSSTTANFHNVGKIHFQSANMVIMRVLSCSGSVLFMFSCVFLGMSNSGVLFKIIKVHQIRSRDLLLLSSALFRFKRKIVSRFGFICSAKASVCY